MKMNCEKLKMMSTSRFKVLNLVLNVVQKVHRRKAHMPVTAAVLPSSLGRAAGLNGLLTIN